MGEYQAVSRLSIETKQLFTPLIEVPEIGWDFENEVDSKTIDQHIKPFAKRVYEKWGTNICFIDFNLINPNERMANRVHPISFVFDQLRQRKCSAIPVTGIDRTNIYQQIVKKIDNILTYKENFS